MKICRIGNGTTVTCQTCREEGKRKSHKIRGYEGNNLGWVDDRGWTGYWDTCHGFFPNEKTNSFCPEHS